MISAGHESNDGYSSVILTSLCALFPLHCFLRVAIFVNRWSAGLQMLTIVLSISIVVFDEHLGPHKKHKTIHHVKLAV
jgi:hypothetical protein